MIRDFSKDELEPDEGGHDTEFTLGGGTLIALACGLFLVCAVCFATGYFVGHRNSSEPAIAAVSPAGAKPLVMPTSSGTKPGAAGQAPAQPQMREPVNASTDSMSPVQAQTIAVAESPGAPQAQVKTALDAQVRPALAGQTASAQPTSPLQVQPAMTKVQGWMVQIAAVSHPEDAEVLVNALRKHGYTVTARRDVGDSLIHVQTGPFTNRNDANAMRQKLLNDGYNAIVQ